HQLLHLFYLESLCHVLIAFPYSFFSLPPPTSTLFPYTTLFRSALLGTGVAGDTAADGLVSDMENLRLNTFFGKNFLHFPQSGRRDRKSTRLNSSHVSISYAVFCLKKKNKQHMS